MLITIFSSLVLSGGQEESLEKQQDLQSKNPGVSEQPTMHAHATTMQTNKYAIRVEVRESVSNVLQAN